MNARSNAMKSQVNIESLAVGSSASRWLVRMLPGLLAMMLLLGPPSLGSGSGGGDETLGGLPSPGDGGGGVFGAALWPEFYLEGSAADIERAIRSEGGERFKKAVEEVAPDRFRVTYRGLYQLELDETVLSHSDVEVGVAASPYAGLLRYAYQFSDVRTRVFGLSEGGRMELPLARIRAHRLFEDGVTLLMRAQIGARHQIELERRDGLLLVRQTR